MISGRFDKSLRDHGTKTTRFTCLAILALKEPQSIGLLATLIGADRSTVTRKAAVAAGQSLVTIQKGDDARSRIVSITSTGQRSCSEHCPVAGGLGRSEGRSGRTGRTNLARRIAGNARALSQPSL